MVLLQLTVTLVVIQRHFEGVTEQMTASTASELLYLRNAIDASNDRETTEKLIKDLDAGFKFRSSFVEAGSPAPENFKTFFDISGIYVQRTLTEHIPDIIAVVLQDDIGVVVYLPSTKGLLKVQFSRARVSATNAHQLLVWTVGFGILLILISYVFLKNQLRPIKRLAVAAEAFGKGRHLPYHPSGASEVRLAGRAFLDMRARIERHIEQRTLLLSGVSHDLRTPLTRLKLALSMSDDPSADEMKRDVEDMQKLLDEFLSFAKRGTEVTLQMEEVNPVQLVENIIDDEKSRGVRISLKEAVGSGRLPLHELSIKRAIENLISNAVKYGNQAEASVYLDKRQLRIEIDDDGPGIPENQRAEALKPFTRLDPARNQNRHTGVGLGLSIAADIAHSHGGELVLSDSYLGGLKAVIVIER